MIPQSIINKYQELKTKEVKDLGDIALVSKELADLSSLAHVLYQREFLKLKNSDYIVALASKGESLIPFIKKIENLDMTLFIKDKEYQVNLKSPIQLVAILEEDFTTEEKLFSEIYLSQSDFFICLNLGLYLESIA